MTHENYMQRCIELARNGLGTTYPNPMVGSVIVHNGNIIGEGWHQKAGGPHAEVNAINSVKDKFLLSEATIYVSLEPCSHFGKTPPCCNLILQHQIPKIVIGTIDPFAKVAGNGIKKLKESGKNVIVGVLETECKDLNKRFFTFHQKKRPYIILKWAESQDGFIAPLKRNHQKPVWISSVYSRQLVHKWRTEEEAIMVGTKTVLDDNPRLDVRAWKGQNPVRVALDRLGKITSDYHIKDKKEKTIIITEKENSVATEQLVYETVIFDTRLPEKIVTVLYEHSIQSVIIEGGRQTIQTFIDAGLWDEARIFKGTVMMHFGTLAPKCSGSLMKYKSIENDELLIFKSYD